MRRRALLAIGVLAATLPALAGATAADAAVGLAYGQPQTAGPALGESSALDTAMSSAGETVLTWVETTGAGHRLQLAAISANAAEAQPTETVASSSRLLSSAEPAIAGNGRAVVAWLEEGKDERGFIGGREALAVAVRERLPSGAWGATESLWRAAPHSGWEIDDLSVAIDQAGDEVVVWRTSQKGDRGEPRTLTVATRPADGAFTAPAPFAPGPGATAPALAIDEAGEATLLWCTSTQIRTSTWTVGSTPPATSAVLDQASSAEEQLHIASFSDLAIQAAGNGSELATWLKGSAAIESRRPKPVTLRAAWRTGSTEFAPAYAISPPGVDVTDPVVAFSAGGSALIAWSQVNADGSGPDLDYATATPGATTTAVSAGPVGVGPAQHPQLKAGWLQDGSALLLWRHRAQVLADGPLSIGSAGAPATIGQLTEGPEEPAEELQLAAGGASSPVLAWVGRSPTDSALAAVRYLPVGQLGDGSPALSAPTAALAGGGDLTSARKVTVKVACPEACQLTASAALFGLRPETAQAANASFYRLLGPLRAASGGLTAPGSTTLALRAPRQTLRAFCRSARRGDRDGIEVHVAAHLASGLERHFVLGDLSGGAC